MYLNFFICRNLLDMDTFSKSDPMCVVSTKLFGSQNYTEIKRTECIDNNLNPEWVTKVLFNTIPFLTLLSSFHRLAVHEP